MSENTSPIPPLVRYRQEAQEKFQAEIVPAQGKSLEELTAYTSPNQVLGELSTPCLQALTQPENNQPKKERHLAEKLKTNSPEGSSVDVVSFHSGNKDYLARRTIIGQTDTLEIFEFPQKTTPGNRTELKYVHLLIAQDGRIIDIIDLIKNEKDRGLYLCLSDFKLAGETVDQEGRIAAKVNVARLKKIPLLAIATEEIGHTYQFEPDKRSAFDKTISNLGDELLRSVNKLARPEEFRAQENYFFTDRVTEERNAKAYFLAVVRRCRSLGVDPFPGINNKDLVSIVENDLARYDQEIPSSPFPFSKKSR